jgi:hypothetical protein
MDNQDRAIGSISPEGGCWPTKEQELLLRASLLEGGDAIGAWKEWESKVDIDSLDQGSRRMLPKLYRNLCANGVKDSSMDKLKGMYRLTWYKNQMLFRRMTDLLQPLHASGIQTMIMKGAALIVLNYKDFGQRPMDDFDVLVRRENVLEAVDLLSELGWKPVTELGWRPDLEHLKANPEKQLSVRHAISFVDEAERSFDLHWHVLLECRYNHADDDYWDAATIIDFHGIPTHVLSPTDQLFHICIHGAFWHPVPTFRWVADAMMVLNTSKLEIDWGRLTSHAEKRRLVLPLRDALAYLRCTLDAPVPSQVLQDLQQMTVSKIERLEYRVKGRPPGLTGGLPLNWFLFLRSSQLEGCAVLRANFIGFPEFLKHVWGLDSLWQLPLHTVSKGMKRIGEVLTGNQEQPTSALPD